MGRESGVVTSNAPSALVIAYASGREKCCGNAIANVTALARGCEMTFLVVSELIEICWTWWVAFWLNDVVEVVASSSFGRS